MTAGPYGRLLDEVRGVRWPAARRVGPATLGTHPSSLRGHSTEFSEFRPYRQGDDPRRLDWRLLARSDRAYVRLTTDRATLRTAVVIDASASMAFPEDTREKWVRAHEIAIALGAVAHADGDPVGLTIAGDPTVTLAPRARRSVIAEMIGALDATKPAGSAPLAPAVRAARAARVAVITDLLGDADALIAECRLRIADGGEVFVIHVIAPAELDPPSGVHLASDPEAPATRRLLDSAGRAAYRAAYDRWIDDTSAALRAVGVRYSRALSNEATPHVVRGIVSGESRTASR